MNTKSFALAVVSGGVAITLSACGSSGTAKAANPSGGQQGSSNAPSGNRFGGGAPGTSGLIAAVSGSTAQVQSTSAQTAVTWIASTTFSSEVAVSAAAVHVGDCVQASRARTAVSSSPSSPSSSASSTIDAATVRIISTSGGCAAVQVGGGQVPRGFPSGAPSGAPGNGAGRGGFGTFMTVGTVSSVGGTGFVVTPQALAGSSTSPVTVNTSSTTTYTETQAASAAQVKAGICMSANGTTDGTGAMTAKRITLSQPTNGVCTTQGRFGGGGFPGGQGAPSGGQGAPQNG